MEHRKLSLESAATSLDDEEDRRSQLNEAMEDIFHPKSHKFSLSDFEKISEESQKAPMYSEDDYSLHRTGSYQHHQPLHRYHHHHKRPSHHSQPNLEEVREEGEVPLLPLPPHVTPTRLPSIGAPSDEQVKFFVGSATSLDTNPAAPGTPVGPKGSMPPPGGGRGDPKLLRPSLKKPSIAGMAPLVQRLPSQPEEWLPVAEYDDCPDGQPLSDLGGRFGEETTPLMSERTSALAAQQSTLAMDAAKTKVTFHLGEKSEKPDHPEEEKDEENKKHHQCHKERHEHRHHHHHHKRHGRRQRLGSDVESDNLPYQAVEPEEAEMLPSADIDDIASRRFEDPRGIRRHKIQAKSSVSSFIHLSRRDGTQPPTQLPFIKKLYDHQPHEIFVELDELVPGEAGDDLEWRETARWIKYEENVEEGSERWGKPHVASLSFHSLLNLRKCLEHGTVLLDLEERDLPGIAYRVVENMVVTDQLLPEHQGALMRALLLRHRHIQERSFPQFPGMRRNNSGYGSLSLISHHEKTKSPKLMPANGSFSGGDHKENGGGVTNQMMASMGQKNGSADTMSPFKALPEIKITMEDSGRRPSQDLEKIFRNSSTEDMHEKDTSILRRIPEGAEATTVLVGALDFLEQPTIAFVRLAESIVMPNLMEVSIPIRFLFVLMGPLNTDLDYHEVGRSISTLMANTSFHEVAYKAEDRRDLLSAINEFLDDSIVLPPGDWERKSLLPIMDIRRKSMEIRHRKKISAEKMMMRGKVAPTPTSETGSTVPILMAAGTPGGDGEETVDGYKPVGSYDPLQRTGCLFGNLVKDVKQRYPWYVSDILDGLNFQCLAAAIFIYFAAISGAITFGGLMGDKTDNLIGVSETLVVTSVCGVIFALLSGQPLIIIGATGPLLLYDEILFKFCHDNDIEYLAMRVWIGIWFAAISTACVALEGSSLVRFFTRFTQEIFAALISLLYIYECVIKVVAVFQQNPLLPDYCGLNETSVPNATEVDVWTNDTLLVFQESSPPSFYPSLPQPNTALMSFILTIGTFFIAYFLRQFRNSKFLGRSARRALGDFGVPIAIILMVSLGYITKNAYTQKLSVPSGLTPSKPEARGWIISPMGAHKQLAVWHILAASLAAMLLFILVFLEVQICELIMYKKDRKLKKGSGFHLDLLLLGYLQLGTGVVGGPWMCAATVRSVSHLASLTVMSRTHAPGQAPYVTEVKEQRLTSFIVALLIGISVLMAPLLRQVPVACLFGVFLYMGISSMSGIQLFDRLRLLFMPVKHHPDLAYVRKVRTWKMNLYTLVQLASLSVLWVVKSTEAALAFPFVLLMMVPFRIQLKCFFTTKELTALDGEDADAEADDEPDFYQQIVP